MILILEWSIKMVSVHFVMYSHATLQELCQMEKIWFHITYIVT